MRSLLYWLDRWGFGTAVMVLLLLAVLLWFVRFIGALTLGAGGAWDDGGATDGQDRTSSYKWLVHDDLQYYPD